MIQLFSKYDRYVFFQMLAVGLLVWLLLGAYMRMALVPPIPDPVVLPSTRAGREYQKGSRGSSSARFDGTADGMAWLLRRGYCTPESAEMGAMPMNQLGYDAIAKLKPDLIGVPNIGSPARITVGRRLNPSELEDFAADFYRGSELEHRDSLVVYGTETGVTCLAQHIDSGTEWQQFCDTPRDCDGKAVDILVSKRVFNDNHAVLSKLRCSID